MLTVLRLGHRQGRDARISTHCGLVARALGADKIIFSGEQDKKLLNSIKKVSKKWGGSFAASYEKKYRQVIKNFSGTAIHLTMYGLPFEKHLKKVKSSEDMLIIVGGEKVPPEVYELADLNLAVTNQPHSEIAALAVLLDKLELKGDFSGAGIKVIPQKAGKEVEE